MLDGPLVFVDIDTQHDFLDPTGALRGRFGRNLAQPASTHRICR